MGQHNQKVSFRATAQVCLGLKASQSGMVTRVGIAFEERVFDGRTPAQRGKDGAFSLSLTVERYTPSGTDRIHERQRDLR